ncbi:unnamed protein product [Caenorhabditis nigoni]
MPYFQAFQFLHLLNIFSFSVLVLIGCEKKKPKSAESNASKKNPLDPSNQNPAPASSHMYVDATTTKSVAYTQPSTKPVVTADSVLKTRSKNPYVKVKSLENPQKEPPPKDMAKEMERLREEASKDGSSTEKKEEDFGYENCDDMTEEQLLKMKAKEAQKKKAMKQQQPTKHKPKIIYKKATKYQIKK